MLARKNIMADLNLWNQLELLRLYRKKTDPQASISKLINEAVKKYIESEKLDELDLALRLYTNPMGKEEARECIDILENLTPEERETSQTIELSAIPEPNKEELAELLKWANS